MKRTNLFRLLYIGLLCIVLMACSHDKENSECDTTSVNITLSTRNAGEAETLPPGEGISTLRVIMIDPTDNNKVVIYGKYLNVSENADIASQVFTIHNVPANIPLDYYLIANEESIQGLTDWLNTSCIVGGSCDVIALSEKVISGFPIPYLAETQDALLTAAPTFPITCIKRGVVVNKDNKNINFSILRTAAKVSFEVHNNGSDNITLNRISLSQMIPNQTYLFEQGTPATPANTSMMPIDILYTGITVAGGESVALPNPYYMFESAQSEYKIGLRANSVDYALKAFTIDKPTNALKRNMHLRIHVYVSPKADLTVTYTVERWTDADITIPPFN
ncbi:MAG: hypothetical protein ACRDDZ_07760 [Marinifilaceae bacterium]